MLLMRLSGPGSYQPSARRPISKQHRIVIYSIRLLYYEK